MVTATFNVNPNQIYPSRVNCTTLTFIGDESRGNVTKAELGRVLSGDCTDVRMCSLHWSLSVTEDQRAGDTSDTETQRRNSVIRPAPAPETGETGDCNAGPERETSVASVAGPGPGQASDTHEARAAFCFLGTILVFREGKRRDW